MPSFKVLRNTRYQGKRYLKGDVVDLDAAASKFTDNFAPADAPAPKAAKEPKAESKKEDKQPEKAPEPEKKGGFFGK